MKWAHLRRPRALMRRAINVSIGLPLMILPEMILSGPGGCGPIGSGDSSRVK